MKVGAFIVLLALTGCMTTTGNLTEADNTKFEKIYEFSGYTKDQLFDIANRWAVQTFNKADSVIEYSNKDAGTIMGKFTYQASAIGLLAAYTIDSARNIITINVRDGAARIIIEFSEVHAMGRGINTWRSANKGEFESVKFPEACKKISNDFEKYVIDGSIAVTKKFEQTDRQNELNLILAHYKENAIKIDSPIIILQGDTSYPDSAGGVSCFVFFQNISSKRIKYVYVTVTPYNRVDDIAYSEIGGESTTVLKYTGYLEPNEWNLFGWGDVWYNATISYIKINKIEIIMEDNSKIILDDEKDINYIMLNEEEGNRWQSSRK